MWNYSSRPVRWNSTGETEDGFIYRETENGIAISGYRGNATALEIPSEINGKPVTTIGIRAFSNCDYLTSAVIPNSVTTIGEYAFYDCDSLKSIVILNTVTTIGIRAFEDCSSLTIVVIPNSVTTIGSSAFYNCNSLTIYCEADSKPEGWDSWWNYSNRPVVWGKCITEDGFVWEETTNGVIITDYKGGKTDIEIPSEINGKPVTTIDEEAFYNCDTITSVVIPSSVTTIVDYAFSWCTSLQSVVIPNSVTTIGRCAFSYCSSLTIYCEAESEPEDWDSYWNFSDRPVVWGHSHTYKNGSCVCGTKEN